MRHPQLKKFVAPVLVSSLALAGSLSAQDSSGARELIGSYGSFSQAALKSAALESFGEGFSDEEQLEGSALDYFKFGVNVRAEYNDNIFLTDTATVDDVILRVSVPLELSNSPTAENQWSLTYVPKFNFYMDNSDQDGIDHHVDAGYSRQFAKTSLDFGIGYNKTKGPSRFAGGNIEKDGFTGKLALSHVLTGKSRLDFDLGGLTEDFVDPALFDRERYNTRLAWQYQATGKVTVGPYIAYEHVSVDVNPNHEAYSAGAKATYQALQKTVVTGYVGVEHRTFSGGSLEDKTTPTYEIGATHQYSGKTSFTGMLYHNIRASYSDAGKSYTATGVNFLARYAYSSRINFNSGVSYEHDNYFDVDSSTAAAGDLDYDYVTFYLGGDYVMDNGFILGSGIRLSNNNSGVNTRDFDNVIFNVNATYNF